MREKPIPEAPANIFTNSYAHKGVSELGLKITEFPQINAALIFQDGIAIGKFHGVIAAT
ncbi:MAG: hypothetical protein UY87_C0062G0001, partial [Candidatus Peribacteria bacterium GW2011_GWC2_54_8]